MKPVKNEIAWTMNNKLLESVLLLENDDRISFAKLAKISTGDDITIIADILKRILIPQLE